MIKSHSVVPRFSDSQNRKHSNFVGHSWRRIHGFVNKLVAFLWVECALIALILVVRVLYDKELI